MKWKLYRESLDDLVQLRREIIRKFDYYASVYDDVYVGQIEINEVGDYFKITVEPISVAELPRVMKYVKEKYGDKYDLELVDEQTLIISEYAPLNESRKRFGSKFVKESEEETEWFDKMGDIKRHFPKDCILDCSSGGRVDDSVDYWVSELNFKVPVDRGLSYVREYGLDDIGPEDVDKYVLWIMCGNIKEEAYEFCRDGSEWEYVDRESYPDEMDNWNDEDWDRFQEEACVCHLGM